MLLAVAGAVFLFITGQDAAFPGNLPLTIVGCVVLVLMGLLSVFSFKNRKLQMMLNNTSIVINALLIGMLFYWLLNLPGGIDFPEKGIEPLFPLISIICLLIANRFIKRDDRLVKSVDRIR